MTGWALVTGASRGIGFAAAAGFARRGLSLALLGRSSATLSAAAREFRVLGAPQVQTFDCDLARSDQVAEVAAGLIPALGSAPDLVLHNAGVVHRARIEELTLASFQEQIAVNLTAPFQITQALLPSLRARRTGRIVFVASISATLGSPAQAAYAASKWGLVGFMKSLAEELKDSGLMTCAVLPGSVDTQMLVGSGFPARMSAEEVARTLLYFALDAPLAHNGAVIEMFGV